MLGGSRVPKNWKEKERKAGSIVRRKSRYEETEKGKNQCQSRLTIEKKIIAHIGNIKTVILILKL